MQKIHQAITEKATGGARRNVSQVSLSPADLPHVKRITATTRRRLAHPPMRNRDGCQTTSEIITDPEAIASVGISLAQHTLIL